MPGYLFSYKKFKELYETQIVRLEDEYSTDRLKRLISPFVLRRIKKEVLTELPDKTITVLNSNMEEEQRNIYLSYLIKARQNVEEELKENSIEKSQIKILALLTRLRQICCHPSLFIDNYNGESGKLNQCIEENKIEIYQTLIPDKIKNFMENAILKLRQSIENQFEIEFTNKNKLISSNDYINKYIHEIIEEINKANFQEDNNMNIVKNYTNIWNIIEKENEGLFKYFIEKKPINIENMKKNFNNTIEKIINNLISQKKVWKTFLMKKK
jgi:hypothetical protein